MPTVIARSGGEVTMGLALGKEEEGSYVYSLQNVKNIYQIVVSLLKIRTISYYLVITQMSASLSLFSKEMSPRYLMYQGTDNIL